MATAVKATAEREVLNDYASEMEDLEIRVEALRNEMRYSPSPDVRSKAESSLEQLLMAIEVYKRAQWTKAEMRQFGSKKSPNWATRVPPMLEEYADKRNKIQAYDYRYMTNDPVEIAWLRFQCENEIVPGDERLEEMDPGLCAAVAPNGNWIGWLSGDAYGLLVSAGAVGREKRLL